MRANWLERIRRALLWDDPSAADRAIGVICGCIIFALIVAAIQERIAQ